MPLYGYKETLDNRTASLVVAADIIENFVAFTDAVKGQEENRNWDEIYTSNFMDGMRDDNFKGYKHPVLAVYHTDEEQRDAFWTEWSVEEVKSAAGRDRQLDMLHTKKEQIRAETETDEDRTKTIEERTGLDKLDPFDRRSEEEREEDKKMKEQMQEMRKKGDLSGDSFSGADKQRESRPQNQDVPGAYGRTKAIDALKSFADDADATDYDVMDNDALKEALEGMGVPDVKGVYNDDEVPQKVAAENGNVHVMDVRGSHNEDGTFDIDNILATKRGGEIDEVAKAERQQEHDDNVADAKAGRKVFSPDDFAAVLRGDGSADAVTHETGDNRHTRQASVSRPSLSDHAEEERRIFKEEQGKEMKRRRTQAEKEQDVKARGERDRGIFKGSDLHPDDIDEVVWDDLPEAVREKLDKGGLKRDAIEVKNYPFNAELGGRAMLPFDGLTTESGMRYVGGVNLTTEGTMTMGAPGVAIVSRTDSSEDGYGIYARRRTVKVDRDAGDLDLGDVGLEQRIDVWLVRVRAN